MESGSTERNLKTPTYLTEPQDKIKNYEKKTHNEPVLEPTTENRSLSLYRSILPAVRHFYGLPAHFVARDEPL